LDASPGIPVNIGLAKPFGQCLVKS
jgi:hypothetical protein